MAMHFVRYQEFYESPNAKFRGKSFTLIDFMEWYASKNDGSFTYPKDWGGYNFPADNIINCCNAGIPDTNKYDEAMQEAYKECAAMASGKKFYIIGSNGDPDTLKHETAHGLYYLDSDYKKKMNALIKELPKKLVEDTNSSLATMGYTSKVFKDEIQAYFATGFEDIDELYYIANINNHCKPFLKVFEEYVK